MWVGLYMCVTFSIFTCLSHCEKKLIKMGAEGFSLRKIKTKSLISLISPSKNETKWRANYTFVKGSCFLDVFHK